MNRRGQALVESIPIFLIIFGLMGILIRSAQWFLIHQKLLIAVRQGAMLYSSGRHRPEEVKRRMNAYLISGSPSLDRDRVRLDVGRWPGMEGTLLRLDIVRASYQPGSWLQRMFTQTMEEKCVIKHAPHYGLPLPPLFGPPARW